MTSKGAVDGAQMLATRNEIAEIETQMATLNEEMK